MRSLLLCPALWLLAGCAAENPELPRSSGIQSTGADRPSVAPDSSGEDSGAGGPHVKAAASSESAARRP